MIFIMTKIDYIIISITKYTDEVDEVSSGLYDKIFILLKKRTLYCNHDFCVIFLITYNPGLTKKSM